MYNWIHPAELFLLEALVEDKAYPVLICRTKAVTVLTEEIIFPKGKGEASSLNLSKFMWCCEDLLPFLFLNMNAILLSGMTLSHDCTLKWMTSVPCITQYICLECRFYINLKNIFPIKTSLLLSDSEERNRSLEQNHG